MVKSYNFLAILLFVIFFFLLVPSLVSASLVGAACNDGSGNTTNDSAVCGAGGVALPTGANSIAVGLGSEAANNNSIAVGVNSDANTTAGVRGIALGSGSQAEADDAIAIGTVAGSTANGTIA